MRTCRWAMPGILAVILSCGLLVAGSASATYSQQDRADVAYERGARALRQGKTAEAMDYLSKAYELDPDRAVIQGAYARALLAAGRPTDAVGVLEDLRGRTTASDDLIMGVALFQSEDYTKAQDHLQRAVQANPDDALAHLMLGATLAESGQRSAAESQLDDAERLEPGLAAWSEYYRGRAAKRSGDQKAALSHFREAERLGASTRVATLARAQIDDTPRKPRRWSVYTTGGVAFDTNVNLAGEGGIGNTGARDWRVFGEIGFDWMLIQTETFNLQAGGSAFLSRNDDQRAFDLSSNRVWAVASKQLNSHVALDLRGTFEYLLTNSSVFYRFRKTLAGEPGIRIRWNRRLLTRLFYAYQNRKYFNDPGTFNISGGFFDLNRDGIVMAPGAEQYWFMPDVTGWGAQFLRAGYRWRKERTHGNEFDSVGNEASLLWGAPLPWRLAMLMGISYEYRQYDKRSVFDPTAEANRSDAILEYSATLRRPMGHGFTAEIGYRYTYWRSNVDFYDYQRDIYHALVTYRY